MTAGLPRDEHGGANFAYGDPMLRLQLDISYSDGSHMQVCSDEEWEWGEGPIRKSNIYLGEVYDANYEIDGWNMAGSASDRWHKAQLATTILRPVWFPADAPDQEAGDHYSKKDMAGFTG